MTTRAAGRAHSLIDAPKQWAAFIAAMHRTLPPGSPDREDPSGTIDGLSR